MNVKKIGLKKMLAIGSVVGIMGLPLLVQAQTTTDGSVPIYDSNGNLIQETVATPGVPSTGVGGVQALANVVLLAASAATALVGGYFLTVGRKNVA